jgi:putative ABC transport system permease protein
MGNLRYAIRVLVKNPGFLITAVLTLALGIGANTAIFSAINTALLQPLPFPEADRLVFVREQFAPGARSNVTAPDFVDWRHGQNAFEAMAASGSLFVTMVEGRTVERWPARRVSADYFRVLRSPLALGRDFTADDEVYGAARTVILSDGLWRARFNADPTVIGRAVTLNSERYTVIGISTPQAQAWRDPDLFYLPLALTPNELKETGNRSFQVSARLKPGMTLAQAEAQLAPLAIATQQARPWSNKSVTIALEPM